MAVRCFLVYLTLTWCLVAGQSPKYVLKGNTVHLEPGINGQPDGILWKHNGNKVVEFNGNEEHVYNPYKDRITLDWVTAELDIANLRFEDSGEYELEVDINKGLHRSVHELEVIDEVAKPTISCEMMDGGSSNKSGKLVCTTEPRRPESLIKFEWSSNGKVQRGPNLLVSLGEKHDDDVYSCHVSNPLSRKTATFTAKDCHPDGSSAALIASLVSIILIGLFLVGLGVLFCKLHYKACFANDDLEKQSPTKKTEGSDEQAAPGVERKPLLHRESTLASTQPLRHLSPGVRSMRQDDDAHSDVETVKSDMDKPDETPQKGVQELTMRFEQNSVKREKPKEPVSLPSTPPNEPPSPLYQNSLASSHKGDLDTEQLGEHTEVEVPQLDLSDPAGVSDDFSEDTNSDRFIAPEQPEPEKEADEDEEAQPAPSNAVTPPVARPRTALTKSSPNTAPKDTAGEHEEEANSDQATEETAENNARESDSSGEGERNESDDSRKDRESPIVPEQKDSKTSLDKPESPQREAHTSEDNQQESVKPAAEVESEKGSVGESEDAISLQPPSPPPTEPNNRNTDTSQESPHAANADPCREDNKTSRDSEGQSDEDEGEGETDESKKEVQSGPKEDKPYNESLSEDKEGQKKNEVIA
ncbi:RNA polymerase-associated protein LEO1-like isoform X2 [Epinephelus fuscoguttatus]|uniref:RNA polymerase-associated protein LEO1-like isoform X2 n=1 Tax=Epinephelus fuscoguttatus TaxID=293821 RepID=UPI0020D03DA4|nr:RNA polymerase-associated protein LEO1-like isoform X2 [Epinephelus fuscoguttatus]